MKHKIYNLNMYIFTISYLLKIYLDFFFTYWGNIIINHNSSCKKNFKNPIVWKNHFGEKGHVILI
jgi:hypothetical protein